MNSIRNKFEILQEIIKQNVDALTIVEIEIDVFFPSAQCFLERYQSSYRLDISHKSGGLLVHVKETVPPHRLSLPTLQFRTPVLLFELNITEEIWLAISIYRPLDSFSRFLESLTGIIHIYSILYNNFIIMGSFFYAQALHSAMKNYIKVNGLTNLINKNNCFKGQGSCSDLILTNKRFSNSYETGIVDHQYLIYSMLKSDFSNSESKLVTYRDHKNFSFENFKTSLDNALRRCSTDYKNFEHIYVGVEYVPSLRI